MKNFVFSFLGLLLIYGCSPRAEVEQAVVFSGKITEPKEKILVLYNDKFEDTINVQEDGTFRLVIDSVTEGYFKFSHGGEYTDLYLFPGDSLFITFDTRLFDETMRYQGRGAEKNNFLAQSILIDEKIGEFRKDIFSLDEKSFREKADSLKAESEKRLKVFLDSFPSVSEKFKKYERAKIIYSHSSALLNYPNWHAYITGTEKPQTSDTYYDFLYSVPKEDESLLGLDEYISYLNDYLDYKTDLIYRGDTSLQKVKNAWFNVKYETAVKEFTHPDVKECVIYGLLEWEMKYGGLEKENEYAYMAFIQSAKDTARINTLKKLYDAWKKLASGNPAPGFRYESIEGKMVALEDLLGKNVYIDVWATWCRPCLEQIPYLEKLQEELKGKNIVFVSISLDEQKEKWQKMVKEKNMKGIHLIANGAWDSGIVKDYSIYGIPRFILINSKGEIIDASAPAPSNKSLLALLKQEAVI